MLRRCILLSLLVILIAPLWAISYLPLVDFPHSIARAYIVANYWHDPALQQTYTPPHPVPDMGIESVAYVLGPGVDPTLVGRVVLSLSIILFGLGISFLAGPERRWNAIAVIPLVYSATLIYGAVNTLFGLSLFVFGFAFWYRLHRRRTAMVAIASIPFLLVLYFVHLSAIALAGVAIAAVVLYELYARMLTVRSATLLLAPLLTPIALTLMFLRSGGTLGSIEWGSVSMKLLYPAALVSTYDRTLDMYWAGAAILLTLILLFRGRIQLDKPFALLALVFYALIWITPNRLFTSSGADIRFLLPATIFLVLSLRVIRSQMHLRWAVIGIVVLQLVRIGLISASWHQMSSRVERQVRLMSRIPQNASLYPILSTTIGQENKEDRGLMNVHCYSVFLRHDIDYALDAYPSQHAVAFRHATGWHPVDLQSSPLKTAFDTAALQIDYVWAFQIPDDLSQLQLPLSRCETDRDVVIWKVDR